MPQFGLKTAASLARPAAVDSASLPPLPWGLPGAEVVQVSFEVDLEATLALLPEQLARPVPPYARIVVARYPESPIGPYAEALLLLSARFAMTPRNYVAAAVVSTEAARAAYAGIWSLPAVVGTVDLKRERNADGSEEINARIAAGSPLVTVHLPGAYAVEPAMVRYDPLVSVRATDGDPELIQFSGAPTVHEARLAKGATATCHTDAWADPWFRLRSLNTISATFAVADLSLTEPAVQQARPGAGMGGGLP
jgi:acetoacetate decarboxylase